MVEAPKSLGVHHTSMSFVYKVFDHLDMLWMGIWVYPYTVTPVEVGGIFWKIGVWLSPSDVVRSCLRLQNRLECIQHPYHMYTKCFITLICCGWAYGSTLTLLRLRRSGVEFGKIGVGRGLSDVVMSWLRLQTHLESIPHPFHMYTKCFITLICCGWAYVCALTLLCLCRLGEDFRKIWAGRSLSDVDVVMSW